MKSDRLFQILYILLERQNITAVELAERLEVSIRTIYRDIEALAMAGIPIFAKQGKSGGISLMSGYTFDKAMLSNDEKNQILLGLQALGAADQNVEGLVSKLGAVFQNDATSWIEVDFSRWGLKRTDNDKFKILKNGILEKQILNITYCGVSGGISERSIKPVRLVFKDKHWYLTAFCMRAEAFRHFKVSRIVKVEGREEHFFESFCDIPPMESNDKPAHPINIVKLKISASLAFRVYDEFELESIEKQEDDSFVVTADFPIDNWVIGYIFSFGTDVEIIEPLELKTQLYEYANKILKHYKA